MYLYTYSAFRNQGSILQTILLKFVIFSPFFQFVLKESNWENLGSKMGKTRDPRAFYRSPDNLQQTVQSEN